MKTNMKHELMDESKVDSLGSLHQIVSLRNCTDVENDDREGWVENLSNLDQDCDADWGIVDHTRETDNVTAKAQISGNVYEYVIHLTAWIKCVLKRN